MKKILWLLALALALPMAAFAGNSVDFSNSGGTLAGTTSGLSLTGSTLIAVNGYEGSGLITGSNLGSVAFTHRRAGKRWIATDGRHLRSRRKLYHHRQWHQWCAERCPFLGHFQQRHLDASYPGKRNP